MTLCAKHRAGEPNRSVALTRNSAAKFGLVIDGIHRVFLNRAIKEKGEMPEKDIAPASILP